ncbi:sugar phosphate isomerase/epimerase family protein [Streptomyces sulphureus]|uniref:sugar phosphate isomerase/epimerase family protein n=1 Tax=Streptomyces sulphureus TaxID=47758 RepID=UPI0003817D5D|nr:sugar phosphate isomerase/epimerase family protein [Streptomyces sulphureus]
MNTAPDALSRLSINQETVAQLPLPRLAEEASALGVGGVGLWREPVRRYGVEAAAGLFAEHGLAVTSLCRGGFFTAPEGPERRRALDDNRAAIGEAAALGAPVLVLVSGGLPPGERDLGAARRRVGEALAELVPYAREHGVRLGVEPLHPMFASDRCVVSTLGQALELAEPFPAEEVGVVVDTYHVWWDERTPQLLSRAGEAGRIAALQLADWTVPLPAGVLLGRGQLGDGCVDLRGLRRAAEAAGYTGPVEVELFNESLRARDGAEVLRETVERYLRYAAE